MSIQKGFSFASTKSVSDNFTGVVVVGLTIQFTFVVGKLHDRAITLEDNLVSIPFVIFIVQKAECLFLAVQFERTALLDSRNEFRLSVDFTMLFPADNLTVLVDSYRLREETLKVSFFLIFKVSYERIIEPQFISEGVLQDIFGHFDQGLRDVFV